MLDVFLFPGLVENVQEQDNNLIGDLYQRRNENTKDHPKLSRILKPYPNFTAKEQASLNSQN